ncbi:hypothetical protein ACFV4P_28795 [Kitasatospora sp. NPDC059795]|uniref:hypothetical protein n=1 Tax=Kitasatospora sp. NPDC059795 TaxID=3346949 RepID=UPI00364C1670
MAEGQQRLETKQISGQVITHTIVKPTNDYALSKAEEERRAAALDEADTASE